jgi:hypothetical protein
MKLFSFTKSKNPSAKHKRRGIKTKLFGCVSKDELDSPVRPHKQDFRKLDMEKDSLQYQFSPKNDTSRHSIYTPSSNNSASQSTERTQSQLSKNHLSCMSDSDETVVCEATLSKSKLPASFPASEEYNIDEYVNLYSSYTTLKKPINSPDVTLDRHPSLYTMNRKLPYKCITDTQW